MSYFTKASTLLFLKNKIKKSIIEDLFIFSLEEWNKDKINILKSISIKFKCKKIIIRSSAIDEDTSEFTLAGKYKSILNINPENKNEVKKSINQVANSLPRNNNKINQIFIQKQILNPDFAGVIFTKIIQNSEPYYSINYDDISKRTNVVTSGSKGVTKQIYILRKNHDNNIKKFNNILKAIKEIEYILGENLDIEFSVKNKQIYIFQVRKLNIRKISKKKYLSVIKYIEGQKKLFLNYSNSFDNGIFLSNMSDWNPAEMIGTNPNNLAISLYKYLITNTNWAKQRFNFGYSDLRKNKLLVSFCGKPYINLDLSILSLIPNSLPQKLKNKLHKTYLDLIKKKPFLHDKIEFDLIFNSWEPKLKSKIRKRFKNYNFNNSEIDMLEESLRLITKNNFLNFEKKFKNISKLTKNRSKINKSNNKLHKAILLLDDVKKYGIEDFAHAARYAFISINFLNSFVENKILSNQDKENFLSTLDTDLSNFIIDQNNFKKKKISKKNLIEKYGHLRPGTYDITNNAYWENFNLYFKNNNSEKKITKPYSFKLTNKQKTKIKKLIKPLDLNIEVVDFFNLMKFFIEKRESFKFEFTKNISLAFDNIKKFNPKLNKNRIKYLSISDLKKYNHKRINIKNLNSIIDHNIKINNISLMTKLPQVLKDDSEFYFFYEFYSKPNFITKNKISGEITVYKKNDINLEDKIVLIEQADPGFDWIFSKNIRGFITKYGGANSHMSIRASETNTTAIVGVGEEIYNKILSMKSIFIDCQNEIIFKYD